MQKKMGTYFFMKQKYKQKIFFYPRHIKPGSGEAARVRDKVIKIL